MSRQRTSPGNGPQTRADGEARSSVQRGPKAPVKAPSKRPVRSAEAQRKIELARIHIAKAKLGLSDEDYRAVVWNIGTVDSAAELDAAGRRALITRLESHLPASARYSGRPHNIGARGREAQLKIEALLTDAGQPWSYAAAIAQRMHRKRLEWLTAEQLAGVIAALEKAALKRLRSELEQQLGPHWEDPAKVIALHLFDFPASRRIASYTEPMSQVLRWLRGELAPACSLLAASESQGACCAGCAWRKAGGNEH